MRPSHGATAIALTVFALLLPAAPAFAGDDRECLLSAPEFDLVPGEAIRWNGTSVVLGALYIPPSSDFDVGGEVPEDGGAGSLALDLFARSVDGATREPRTGSMVPGLAVKYTVHGREGVLASGTMDPHLTADGPAYGAEIPFPAGEPTVRVSLDVVDAGVGAVPDHDPSPDHDDGVCPRVPANLQFVVDVAERRAAYASSEPSTDAPDDDRNTRLVGTIDPVVGAVYNDIWGYFDGTTYLAILGAKDGTWFIDVTDPEVPAVVGFVAGPDSSWRDIKTYGTYAYIVTEGSEAGTGLQIVDLSDPLDATLVTTYTTNFTTAHNIWIDAPRGHAWVVGTSNGTRILDIATDPENPIEIGSWTERYVHDAYVADGWAYFSEINNGLHEILDAEDVSSLTVLSTWATPTGDSHNSWANDDHTVVATTDETTGGHVAVYDITSKTGPIPLLSEYEPNSNAIVHNVKFDDGDNELIAISHYALGLKVVDLHRPTQPVEWMSYDTYPAGDGGFNGAWGIYAFDPRGYYYISDIQTGLYVLEYDPTGGTLSGVVRDAVGGLPVEGARVVQLSDGAVAHTGADGVYGVYAAEGAALLRVDAWGYRSAVVDAGTVVLGERLDADISLDPIARVGLSGVVRRADTDQPIEGVAVRIDGSLLATSTAPDGSYAFTDVAVGQQTVIAERFGFASAEPRVTLVAGQPATLDIALDPGAFADDMEQDTGWTFVSDVVGQDGEWERGEPNGTGGGSVQPGVDATPDPGVEAWVTGNEFGATIESDDVDAGDTTLLSPAIDASGFEAATVGYQRWVSTGAGFLAGGEFLAEVSSDGGTTWSTLESRTASAASWTGVQFDLGNRTTITDDLRVRFVASPTTQLTNYRVFEAAIDDFEIVRGCRARFNPEAPDADADGTVDACDGCPLDAGDDADSDGVCGDVDNAPVIANSDQTDTDSDGVGDVADNCPVDGNDGQHDTDRDGEGDTCDDDIDGDGIPNDIDPDDDGDGVDDRTDNCPENANSTQADRDLDGTGDLCDPEDGVVHFVRVDGERVSWAPESGAEGYHVYRGDLGAEALLSFAACRASSVAGNGYVDPDLPRPSDGYVYLVTRVVGGVGGSLGEHSDGTERTIGVTCP